MLESLHLTLCLFPDFTKYLNKAERRKITEKIKHSKYFGITKKQREVVPLQSNSVKIFLKKKKNEKRKAMFLYCIMTTSAGLKIMCKTVTEYISALGC